MDDLHLEYEDDPLEPLPGVGGEQLTNVFHVISLHQLVGPEKDNVYFDSHFVTIPVLAIIGMNRQRDWCCHTLIPGFIVRNNQT